MLSTIPITDNFEQIDEEYKKFKHIIFNLWCEFDQYVLDSEEKKLIQLISFILQDTEGNQEENLIRALIGARVLSKYSIMNQKVCVTFFPKSDSPFPRSIQKRRFILKSIAKKCKSNTSYEWDSYIIQIQNKILPMKLRDPGELESTENALIYIDFLIQYSPDFVLKFSNEILTHLLQIIRKNNYIFDLTYDILSKTKQTQDQYFTNENHYFANNAIELLRKILLNIKSIRYHSIDINDILSWEPKDKLKILAVLSVLLESCGNSFLKQYGEKIRTFLNFQDDNQEIRCLICRNLIFCLGPDETSRNNLIQNYFSIEPTLDPNIICAMLQNLKLLIVNDHNTRIQQRIFDIAIKFINENDTIRNNVFDILNTFYLIYDEEEVNNLISGSQYTDQIFDTIHLEFNELAKSMAFYKPNVFFTQLSEFLTKNPFEALLFLNNNKITETNDDELAEFSLFIEKNDEDNYIIEQLKDEKIKDTCQNIINSIFQLAENEDPKVRSLVPLVLIKLCPEQFLLKEHIEQFIPLLLIDPSNQVKLALLQSLNYLLNLEDKTLIFNDLKNVLESETCEEIFRPLLDATSPQDTRIEAIKFFSLMAKKGSEYYFIKEHINCYKKFADPSNKYAIIQRKLASSSEFLPYIFNTFSLNDNDFDKFYSFSIDFLNIVTKNKTNYINQTNLQIDTLPKSLFQLKFYETIFCSYVKGIKLLFKIKPDFIKLHIEELINLCLTNLYYGITEKETIYVLSLLEQCLYYIGLERTIEINNRNIFDTNLYQIVFNTGAHFISPLINRLIFRILGFIGGQIINEKQILTDNIPDWKANLNYSFHKMSLDNHRRLYFYSECSDLLYNILEDESMAKLHFNALNSLITIQKRASINDEIMISEFKRSFNYFKILLNSTSIKAKDGFVPLLKILIGYAYQVIKDSIPDLVQCLIDLWEFGSSSILPTFASILKLNLSPYLNQIIPLVISLEDSSETVNLLVSLYKNVVFNVNDKRIFFLDIINILIQMINERKYEALDGINQLIPIIVDLYEYVPSIVNTCLENISKVSESLNQNKEEEEAALEKTILDNTTTVLNTLLLNSKNSLATSEIFEVYRDSIIESLGPFPDKSEEFNENIEIMRNIDIRSNINYPESNREGNQEKESDYLQFSFTEFVKLVTSIDKLIEDNEVNSLYIQQWLNELIMYCIQNSPSFTIRNTFQIAKNYPSFAISLFNIAFYSMLNHKVPRQPVRSTQNAGPSNQPPSKKATNTTNSKKKSHIRITGDSRTKVAAPKKVKKDSDKNEIKIVDGHNRSPPNPNDNNPNGMPIQMPPRTNNTEANNRNQPITNTFISLFKLERMPFKCRSILLNLVIFMDRANAPIFNINDLDAINRPITSIFADNPPLSLLFSLRRFYRNLSKEKIQAQVDLERAFLNAGLVDQYHHFIRTNQITNVDDDSFILPIFTNTLESIHQLKKANDFFLLGNWDTFNEQIDLSDHQIISRLFRTAFMIRDYWKSNPNNNSVPNLTNDMIFNYIDYTKDENYSKKLEIWKEIELGFDALSHEIGTSFTQGNAPTFQSIIYGQQLVELQEMFFSNGEINNFILRFLNTDQISSFLHHILLLRIAAKGQSKDSLHEKLELFSLCRKSSKWNLMNKYFNYFYGNDNTQVPVEIQYEMIYYKLATNTVNENEINDLYNTVIEMEDQTNNFGEEYEYETLANYINYQLAVYHAHKSKQNFRKVIDLCEGFDNADAINLWSWANLKLYQKGKKKKYLLNAIRGYVKGSLMSDKMSDSNMISIVSLLFTYFPNNYDIDLIKNDLNKLPLYLYINCTPQIISYIHKLNENDQFFNEFIYNLLIELMAKYPHGVIYEYTFSLFCDNREKDGKIIKSPIDKVRNYFLQHREILSKMNTRNIFYQAYELTNNLYKVSSDIKSIIYNFATYVVSFVSDELITAHYEIEINDFIKNLEYTNKQYAIPLYNFIVQNESNQYEPNETERADISNLIIRGLFSGVHRNINELIVNFKQLLQWREKYYNNAKKLSHKKIKRHQKEFNTHLKKEIIKKPKKEKSNLTSSYRPRNCPIITDSDEIEESSNNNIDLNEQNPDVIEVTPLLSLPYSDKQLPTLVLYDKSDSVENNIAVESTSTSNSEEIININRNNSNRNNETQVSFHSNIIPQRIQRDRIAELERNGEIFQRNIDECICRIKTLYDNFQYYRYMLKKHIDTSSLQVNMMTESPKMEGMVDLCLPVFGTYQHNQEPILIQRFEPKCVSKKSLARPKVIHIIGNNGVDYSFMLKASEDLRADQRFMIFFRFLNRFIPTKIRTYSVTPLTVRFGVIEFVHNTMSISEMIGINRSRAKVSNNCEHLFLKRHLNEGSNDKPYDKLTYIQHYEILHELTGNFPKRSVDLRNSMWYCAPNAETWVKYIVNFNKSCAVTSIVGYIIGIGDRHNENIMFDKSNGSIVHIDFTDCFEINQQRVRNRERVPFRLTRNIVTALGPCGCNGTFRSSCEVVLDSIRENREIIYNILEVFSVSPIQPYGRVKDIQRSEDEINHSLEKNKSVMKRIEKKLNGTDRAIIYDRDNLKRKSNENDVPMSVQEHVERLIAHASSEYYISSSYSGWCPYL